MIAYLIGTKAGELIHANDEGQKTVFAGPQGAQTLPFSETRKTPGSKEDYSMKLRLVPEKNVDEMAEHIVV